MTTAEDIIAALNLSPHPEGGFFRETYRDSIHADAAGRAASTCIYYVLRAGERSRWHTVDATEIWHFYAGAPLCLRLETAPDCFEEQILGQNLAVGERPQIIVPPGAWQSATPRPADQTAWTLVGCTVAPGFTFDKFYLATDEEEQQLNAKFTASA